MLFPHKFIPTLVEQPDGKNTPYIEFLETTDKTWPRYKQKSKLNPI